MLHEIFQEALLANQWDLPFLCTVIDRIMEKHMEDLYTIKVGLAIAREHLQSKMTELTYWAKAFVTSQPQVGVSVLSPLLVLIACRMMLLLKTAMGRRPTWPLPSFSTLRSMSGHPCMD